MKDHQADEVEITIPLGRANIYSFLIFFIATVAFGVPFALIWGWDTFLVSIRSFLSEYFIFFLSIVGGVIMHELLHAVTWAAYCKNGLRSVKFGFNWQHLSPYVHCSEYLRKPYYVAGVVMPGLVLGLLPAILSIFLGSGWMLWFGVFFTAGAAGDLLCLLKLRPVANAAEIIDHPEHLGFKVRQAD
jgi:hypothetical protein